MQQLPWSVNKFTVQTKHSSLKSKPPFCKDVGSFILNGRCRSSGLDAYLSEFGCNVKVA